MTLDELKDQFLRTSFCPSRLIRGREETEIVYTSLHVEHEPARPRLASICTSRTSSMAANKTNSKRKGSSGEREAVHLLLELGFTDAKRTQQYNGLGKSDVECAESLPDVHIEVKRDARIDIGTTRWQAAIRTAIVECGDKEWCVLWRRDGAKLWRLTYRDVWQIVTVDHSRIEAVLRWLQNGREF